MLDAQAAAFARARLLRPSRKPLAIDSTCFEQWHRSVHYDRRCRKMGEASSSSSSSRPPPSAKPRRKPGSWGRSANAARRRRLRAVPKLAVAVAGACHLILAARVRTGNGSDAPDFVPLLRRAVARAPGVAVSVADAGYDAEENHRVAREELGVRSVIPPGGGRPPAAAGKPPGGRWRRHVARRFAREADRKHYGQRAQSETVHSMVKRNLGSALRSRTPERRKKEMLLRMLTHNIMLAAEQLPEE